MGGGGGMQATKLRQKSVTSERKIFRNLAKRVSFSRTQTRHPCNSVTVLS